MSASVKQFVRYWGFLLSKFLIAGSVLATLIWIVNALWAGPAHPDPAKHFRVERYILYLVCFAVVYMLGIALFYLCVLDQRYRCRVCLRRLRMPVETGSWSRMLQLGRPHMEYICLYGHGKLNIPELHLTGTDAAEWTEHGDYWAELCAIGDPAEPDRR